MKIKSLVFPFCLMNCCIVNAQIDSLNVMVDDTHLEELVITSQIEPQSLKKAINNVRVISKEDIQNLGAVTLNDVLNQYINITVTPSGSSGRSTVSMFGLGSVYFKILIDNVPIVNENGLGNNTDISQISLNDVEQIEIIEGAMGVTHGANAVSGILNIITKKSSDNKWEVQLTSQEETAGNEFSFFKEGKHIQNIKINNNINENLFATFGVNRIDFKGYLGDQLGQFHDLNDSKRGYKWNPSEQIQANALISYRKDNLRLFYKFEYLTKETQYFHPTVQSGYNETLGAYKYSEDERYFTNRVYNHLNASGKIFNQVNFNISASYQMQKREEETFRYNITNDIESLNNRIKDQAMEVLYSTGTFSNFFNNKIYNLQLGYEIVSNKGFSVVDAELNKKKDVNETISNYDFFAVSEINVNDRFSVRPGIRYSFQSMFDNQYSYSLGGRYLLNNGFEARAALGRSYRTPDFQELYFRNIFDGHYFVGNENLVPETSTSFEASVKKITNFKTSLLSNHIMFSMNDIDDRITDAYIGDMGATPMYQYINVSKYKSINISTTNQYKFDNWNFNLNGSFTWISQVIDNAKFKTSDEFLFAYSLNSNLSYFVPKWNTTFAAYYKFTGKTPQWVIGSNDYLVSEMGSYSWLDFSIRKGFWNNKFETTVGARNLFNVGDVNRTRLNEGGGHTVDVNILLAYGRSYFVKLTYNLNFN